VRPIFILYSAYRIFGKINAFTMPNDTFPAYLMPTLTVNDCRAAVSFYKEAFGATETFSDLETLGSGLAVLAIGDAQVVVADESPAHGNISAKTEGPVSIRMGLMVPDPDTIFKQAIDRGAKQVYAVADQSYGYRLGHLVDPFGHHWEIGRALRN
jgi:PhnB protein